MVASLFEIRSRDSVPAVRTGRDFRAQRQLREAHVLLELCAGRRGELEAWRVLVTKGGVGAACELQQEVRRRLHAHRKANNKEDQLWRRRRG